MLASMRTLISAISLICVAAALSAQSPAKPANVTCNIATHPNTDADVAFASGRFGEAESLYNQQITTSPSESAWQGLVHAQIELDKAPDALATAKRANDAIPHSAAIHALTGDAELRAGHIDEASAAYAEARALDPCSAAAHFGTARILELSAMRKSAQRELAFAHRLAPADTAISEALFSTLPAPMDAKGLRNLLASDHNLSPDHRHRLEQEAALLEMGATCQTTEASGTVKVDLTPLFYDGVHLRDYGVRVGGGGTIAVNLELDSTASGIVLSETDAKSLHVTPAVADYRSAPYSGFLSILQIGHLRYEKCPVSVVPDATLAHRYSVIGTDFFRRSLIHLDWNAKQITLTPYPQTAAGGADSGPVDADIPAGEKEWSHVFIDQQRILMPALVEKRPAGLLMLDTSYTVDMLSPSAAQSFRTSSDATLAVVGVSGDLVRMFAKEGGGDVNRTELIDFKGSNMPIRLVGLQEAVRFAGNEPPIFGLWSFDISRVSHAAGLEVGGIIGFQIVRQYYVDIDYRDALIQLKYDLGFPLRQAALISR